MIINKHALNAMGFEVHDHENHIEILPTGRGTDELNYLLSAVQEMGEDVITPVDKDEMCEHLVGVYNKACIGKAIMTEDKWERWERENGFVAECR